MKNTIQINNLNITKRDSLFGDYFIIYDNDNNEAYFAFENKLSDEAWNDLETKANTIKEILLEYEKNTKGHQITDFKIIDQEEFIN